MKTLRIAAVAALTFSLAGCQLINSAVGSGDNKLLSLVLKVHQESDPDGESLDLYPQFSSDQTTYVAASSYPYTDSYSISAKANSGSSRVVVLGDDVTPVLGVNHLQVLVTAENGSRRTYDIYAMTGGLDVTASENEPYLGTLHVVNHSGSDLKDLRYGLTTASWEDNLLFDGDQTLAQGESRDVTVYVGPLDVWAASEAGADATERNLTSSFLWDTYAGDSLSSAHGLGKVAAVLPGQTLTYEIK